MKFEIVSGDICSFECDAIVVNLFEGVDKPSGATGAVDVALGGAISSLIKEGEIKGKLDETHVIHSLGKMPARVVLIAGMGKREDFNPNKLRNLIGEVVRALRKHSCKKVASVLHGAGAGGFDPAESAQAIIEGCLLGDYKFTRHLTKNDEEKKIEQFILVERDGSRLDDVKRGVDKGKILAEAAIRTRNMVNEPGNHMTPTDMAVVARELADKHGLEITIMDREQMRNEGMGALLGVAQGTSQPPKFIVLQYRGDSSHSAAIGFVGKGLTFDSGGISLKPQEFMSDMKGDMAGGAAVMAAVGAIAELGLKVNVTAIVPATENLPGGKAIKPGDVIKAMNGKTIEVINTDAEGRLILADALCYAVKQGLSPIIDLATLTGACHIALGDLWAGAFSNDPKLVEKLISAGSQAGEQLWQLPLPDDYKELNKSDIADIKNSGGRYAGAITAALFLQEFVNDVPWVHVDIAGPFMSDKTKGILVKGATGFGARTLVNYAINYFEQEGNKK